MKLTWLGWAGVELEVDGATLVIDPLDDAAAVFAPLGPGATTNVPAVVPPSEGTAVAGFVTHLHRDHADAAALARAGGPVFEPARADDLALAQANHELSAAGLERSSLDPWQTVNVGPFQVTALPAADGIGDPQVSWLVEADGKRVLHCGDTIWHGNWWRIAKESGPIDVACLPVNGARLNFPHRQPPSTLPGALTPEQAALAAKILGAAVAIPIHAEGYEIPGVYEPVPDATQAFLDASPGTARSMAIGETIEVD